MYRWWLWMNPLLLLLLLLPPPLFPLLTDAAMTAPQTTDRLRFAQFLDLDVVSVCRANNFFHFRSGNGGVGQDRLAFDIVLGRKLANNDVDDFPLGFFNADSSHDVDDAINSGKEKLRVLARGHLNCLQPSHKQCLLGVESRQNPFADHPPRLRDAVASSQPFFNVRAAGCFQQISPRRLCAVTSAAP